MSSIKILVIGQLIIHHWSIDRKMMNVMDNIFVLLSLQLYLKYVAFDIYIQNYVAFERLEL